MDPIDALQACGGVAPWGRLRTLGVTPSALRGRLAAGHVLRLRHGVPALPGASPEVVGVVRLGGVLSSASAAQLHQLPLLVGPTMPHVTVPRDWSRAIAPGIVVHRRDLDADLLVGAATTVEQTVLRLLATPPGRLEPQVRIHGVGRVDLLVDGWLVLEADGFEYHSDRATYREDRRRANALATAGYVLIRFTYGDITHRPEYTIETMVQVLRRGPRVGFTPRHT